MSRAEPAIDAGIAPPGYRGQNGDPQCPLGFQRLNTEHTEDLSDLCVGSFQTTEDTETRTIFEAWIEPAKCHSGDIIVISL